MEPQILVIHGGETFDSHAGYMAFLQNAVVDPTKPSVKDWKANLANHTGYEVIAPTMPCKLNAKYAEWEIWFKKYLPYIRPDVILIGHSLGGLFLAKYLSENEFRPRIKATFLMAAPYFIEENAADFLLPDNLELFSRQGGQIFIFHSVDDMVVPFTDSGLWRNRLPKAISINLKNMGHLNVERIPQLIHELVWLNRE